jgi:hypothetical protein
MADGAIYDFFGQANILRKQLPALQRYIGIDYGTHNPTCFLEFGRNDLRQLTGNNGCEPRIWSDREYYWDSVAEGRQKDDAEYAKDFLKFTRGKEYDCCIYDPSAASLILAIKNALREANRQMVFRAADNSVLDGIKTQARMLVSGEYMVGENCYHTQLDYGAYVWDKKRSEKGEDTPLKVNDHTKDVERYVLQTLFGGKTIDYANALK